MSTTRYYLYRTAPGVVVARDPLWSGDRFDPTAYAKGRLDVAGAVAGDSVISVHTASSPQVGWKMLNAQHVGPATLPAGPIIGTVRAVLWTNSQWPNAPMRLVLRVVSGDGATVRGTLANLTATPPTTRPGTQTVSGPLTPVTAQAGDRLVVELGGDVGGFAFSFTSWVGRVIAQSDLAYAHSDPTGSASKNPWLEIITPDPPNPPTGLIQTAATPVSADVAWTAPVAGEAPTSYEYRIDGGAPVDVGLVTATTIPGLSPGTSYTIEVRTVAATGVSAWAGPLLVTTTDPPPPDKRWWTQKLAAALGLDPAGDQPVVEVRTYDHATDTWTMDPDLSAGLTDYSVTYGRRGPTGPADPVQATLGFAAVRLPATPPVATRLQVGFCDAVAAALGLTADQAIRFTGEVTDPTVDHDAARTGLVCVGRLARGYRRPVDGTTWPVEDDGARIARILAAVTVDTGTIDTGSVDLAVPTRLEVAARLVDQVIASTTGQLVEQPTGVVDWHDVEHRRDLPVHITLEAGTWFRRVSWSQRLDSLVNDLDLKTAAGTVVTVTDTESADPTRYGPWPGTADTILTTDLDAYELGVDIVGRRAEPSWQLPDLTADLIRTVALVDLPEVLTLRHGSLVELAGLPDGCPVPPEVHVEGWVETATPRNWRLQVSVSDPIISGTGLRWIDWPDTDAYQWQDLHVDLTWLDLARITDPTATL